MPLAGCLSFIYILCHHNTKAFYPPARASNPQMPVYVNLQPPRRTARTSLHGRWALTPPSHPYPCGRLFSSALLCSRKQLSVRKWCALCCPDFPPLLFKATATDRPTAYILSPMANNLCYSCIIYARGYISAAKLAFSVEKTVPFRTS